MTHITIHHYVLHILGLTILRLDLKLPTLNYIIMVKKCEEGCIIGGREERKKVLKTYYSIELYLKDEGVEHKTISIPFVGCV